MQQTDFRALIASSSRPAPSSSSYTTVSERKAASLGKDAKPSFKPRGPAKEAKDKGKEKVKADLDAPQWRDRAKERRMGAAEATDASIPTPAKGLDFALLEQRKQEQNAEAEAAAEDDLEAAFLGQVGGERSEPGSPEPAKKTREQLLADLATRQAAARTENATDLSQAKAAGKFRRLGETEKLKPKDEAVGPKVIDAKTGKIKKLRKRKKEAPMSAPLATTSGQDVGISPSGATPLPVPPAVVDATPLEPTVDGDDDADIFADAKDYDAFESDEDEKQVEDNATESLLQRPRKIFDDDDEEVRADPLALPAKQPVAPSVPDRNPQRRPRGSDSESDDEPQRLQGFSDSADIRSLLEIDKAAVKDEKKRERKEQRRALAAGEAPPPKKQKQLTAKDKLNRDYLEYEKYVKSK